VRPTLQPDAGLDDLLALDAQARAHARQAVKGLAR
jgi:hypothetical protein